MPATNVLFALLASWLFSAVAGQEVADSGITLADVEDLQAEWGSAIKNITKVYMEDGDFVGEAMDAAAKLYGYGHSAVLFKPTKAVEHPFRPDAIGALSYFVGGNATEGGFEEDTGFAINEGKGWDDVVFDNHKIELLGPVAIAMGHYTFTQATGEEKGKNVTVEYTFGYMRNPDGKDRIFLHHSSVPYKA